MKIKTFFCGILMGAADVIPGVSGGTMALITGIYARLINSLDVINAEFLVSLKNLKIKKLIKAIDWSFLIPLFAGILTSIFFCSKFITYLINNYPSQLNGFFFGLVLSSIFIIFKSLTNKNLLNILVFIFYAIITYVVFSLGNLEFSNSPINLFICSALAICAMLLPGISGSYVLVMLGQYAFIIKAVADLNLNILIIVFCGCLLGLILFSKIINFLMHNYKQTTLISLLGIMLGSLRTIWPWKYDNSIVFPNLIDQGFIVTVLLLIIGIAIPLIITKISAYRSQNINIP